MSAGVAWRETVDPALLIFAFSAGAAAFFAPCCVAMLPAYVAYAVRPARTEGWVEERPFQANLGRGVATLGLFPLVMGAIPLIGHGLGTVGLLPEALYPALPAIDLSISFLLMGAALLIVGLVLSGKGPSAIRGLLFGGLATLGFFATFLLVGLPVAFLAKGLAPYLTYLSASVGVALVGLGVLMLFGKSFSPRLPSFEADVSSPKGFLKFGLAYGVAGLSCTFPVFLAVVAAGALAGGFTSAMMTFAAYALGKASVLVAITVVIVAGGTSLGARLKKHATTITWASAIMLVLTGAYMTFYFGRFAFIHP